MKTTVELDAVEWGQVLDALSCRIEQYEETIRFYETGYATSLIEEVRDVEEARFLRDTYQHIVENIRREILS
ncbi:MAG: hypothetical protein JXR23_02195 [Pontiellaceae bacterium]|nr:hypothetical protein [Pontiellaceae bacterium]